MVEALVPRTPERLALIFTRWIPIAIVATILCGLVLGAVQQDLRQTANDPQIQLAEDAAVAIRNGQDPQSVVPAGKVDISQSLAPYVIVFDATGRPLATSAKLGDEIPRPPAGVFDYVKQHGEDRFSWQPRAGVRSAAVVVPIGDPSSGYVLAGRSLREIENREDQLNLMVGLAWIASLGTSLLAVTVLAAIPVEQIRR